MNSHFDTEGPFGVPMKDAQARALETRLKDLPKDDAFAFRRCTLARGLAEWQPEGRADVSWITEESPDRVGDIVLARGMDDSHFALNPLVTLNHNYAEPPVGRSLWRRTRQGGQPRRHQGEDALSDAARRLVRGAWPPDVAFDLLQSGLLLGKSIGFSAAQGPRAERRGAAFGQLGPHGRRRMVAARIRVLLPSDAAELGRRAGAESGAERVH